MAQSTFHLWFPNLFEFKGGIQTYSAFLLAAIQNIYPENNYRIFLKHDRCSSPNYTSSVPARFHCAGNVPPFLRTTAFATELLTWGIYQRPDLVITSHLNFTIAAYWLKRLTNIPYLAIAHGIEAWDIQNPALKRALHDADLILAVSEYTRDRLLEEQNLKPSKVSLLANTFNAQRFQIAAKPQYLLERHKLTIDQPIILTVARLEVSKRYKGYDQMLQAMPEIIKVLPNAHYILVGKGADRTRIEKIIAQLNLQQHVTLAGFIPDSELSDYYNLCDVFAMPSKGEGFGIVYLEAMACGKPVLASNQYGATDALCHGELGALVNPDDISEITQTIIQILQSKYPNGLIYQPENLRQKVIEKFGFEHFQHNLSHHFEKSFIKRI